MLAFLFYVFVFAFLYIKVQGGDAECDNCATEVGVKGNERLARNFRLSKKWQTVEHEWQCPSEESDAHQHNTCEAWKAMRDAVVHHLNYLDIEQDIFAANAGHLNAVAVKPEFQLAIDEFNFFSEVSLNDAMQFIVWAHQTPKFIAKNAASEIPFSDEVLAKGDAWEIAKIGVKYEHFVADKLFEIANEEEIVLVQKLVEQWSEGKEDEVKKEQLQKALTFVKRQIDFGSGQLAQGEFEYSDVIERLLKGEDVSADEDWNELLDDLADMESQLGQAKQELEALEAAQIKKSAEQQTKKSAGNEAKEKHE